MEQFLSIIFFESRLRDMRRPLELPDRDPAAEGRPARRGLASRIAPRLLSRL